MDKYSSNIVSIALMEGGRWILTIKSFFIHDKKVVLGCLLILINNLDNKKGYS
jgi:hypothetical protein